MGKIVKSIGKAIKKVGKGIKKIVKKIGPVLLIAAAVYAGVAFYGASLPGAAASSGLGKLSVTNFMAGISQLGTNVMGFVSPGGGGGGLAPAPGLTSGGVANQLAGMSGVTGSAPGTIDSIESARNIVAASQGKTLIGADLAAVRTWVNASYTPASGMTTGEALKYMTKWNMWKTGAEMAAGIFSNKEEDEFNRQKELLAMRYSYGAPSTDEQKAFLADNPNYFKGGTQGAAPALQSSQARSQIPAWMGAQTQANLAYEAPPPSPYITQQTIGQPTFGRRSTTQFETPARRTAAAGKPGLLTQAAKMRNYS
jgi:hypothetical protein